MALSPPPRTGSQLVRQRVRYYYLLIALIVAVFAAETMMHFTHDTWSRWIVTITALVAAALAVGSGLRAADLGLSPGTWARGARWAAVIVVVVVAAIGLALAVPPLRDLFHNDAYRDLRWALFSAFVLIPLQTVIPEELLFRGIVTGALLRRHSVAVAISVQAVLFGLWHIVSSIGLAEGNAGIGSVVGSGAAGQALSVIGAVAFTAASGAVFGWLRVRTGSLLPCIALHWAANGAGAIAAAFAWHLS
ncbi:CPBP family intramembrane metalloprotease [Gordonia sp. HY002]|uniref:CPBP family intramembrane glutamic endopeptidase n=1 Tax=Gordonia zhenghanii TaxID=2911516 RepID=UPI001EF0C4E1|nr:CPBP family intramembrane glutamic endopeptidase [Gordonia zhenghanii]MCF8571427.1 CPBP family intramembrane metalloprotease [Gordonia zhenghanii]MCF8608258.1 CPBP family intramembrane metalloprotease [Gordonia zhenghanii]